MDYFYPEVIACHTSDDFSVKKRAAEHVKCERTTATMFDEVRVGTLARCPVTLRVAVQARVVRETRVTMATQGNCGGSEWEEGGYILKFRQNLANSL